MNWRRMIELPRRTPLSDLVEFGLELVVRIAINAAVGAVAGAVIVWVGARALAGRRLRWGTAYWTSFAGYAATCVSAMGLVILLGGSGWVLGLGVAIGFVVQALLFARIIAPAGAGRLSLGRAAVVASAHTAVGVLLYWAWYLWAFG